MKHLISIIIVNWDGEKYLKDCLLSLLKVKTQNKLEIIVVDNGSKDGSIIYLKSQELRLKKKKIKLIIIENKKNLGFAEGNNQGVKKSHGDLILFLNNDTKVPPNFLDILVDEVTLKDSIAAVQPLILYMEQPDIVDSTGSFFTKTGILYHRGHQQNKGNPGLNTKNKIFSMKGACMLFKKKVLDEVGVFDESFFAYFEETDLCHRVLLAGYDIFYMPKSVIYHKVGGSTSKVGSPFIQYHSFKNRIQSYIINFEGRTLVWLMPTHLFLSFVVALSFLALGKLGHFVSVFKAYGWIIRNFGAILQKREYIQGTIRKVKDNNYLPGVTRNASLVYYWYLLVGGLEKMRDT